MDRLLERGDSVIVVDNFFTGRKENIMHHLQNPFFEVIRHDVVEPILAGRHRLKKKSLDPVSLKGVSVSNT